MSEFQARVESALTQVVIDLRTEALEKMRLLADYQAALSAGDFEYFQSVGILSQAMVDRLRFESAELVNAAEAQ